MNRKLITVSILGGAAICFLLSITCVANVKAQAAPGAEAERAGLLQKARKALAGTTWTVYTSLQDARRPEGGTEVFTFTERRVTTQELAKLGYSAGGSNYSVHIEGDGVIVWETMAKHQDGEGEALLRGDLNDGVMTGAIDIQPAKGQRKVYRFSSQKPGPLTATATTAAATTKPKKK